MRWIWGILLILLLLGGGYYLGSYLIPYLKRSDIMTKVGPPQKTLRQYLPQGSTPFFPIQISGNYKMGLFADLNNEYPRDLVFDPQGVLLASIPSKGKVVALPDSDRDGTADQVVDVITGLNNPHGLAFDGETLYVAETDKVVTYKYNLNDYKASNPTVLFTLPGGGRHSTRTLQINNGKLYTSVGSSCDVCVENNSYRASILVSDLDGSNLEVFAKGLRNTVFFAFDEEGRMWGNDMGRDDLGDDLPPDELNIIEQGKDYGWPYCYGNKNRDLKFRGGLEPSYCVNTQAPKYSYPAHVAPLGIAFIRSSIFPPEDQGNILVAFHGSWNSSEPVGYKIVKLSAYAGEIGEMRDFITGFNQGNRGVLGRPVDLIFDAQGRLFISDDKAGLVYIVWEG